MFGLGWQVLRERLGSVVDGTRVRRAFLIAAAVAVAVVVVAVLLQLRFGWAGPGTGGPALVIVLSGVGVGLVVFSCFPTDVAPDPAATINGRAVYPEWQTTVRGSVQPYVARRPAPVTPADRAAVLNDVPLLQRGLIRKITRTGPFLVGLGFVGAALFVGGGSHGIAMLWTIVYLASLPELVVRLGRAERARLAALATEPPATDTAPGWGSAPNGSKARLPGD